MDQLVVFLLSVLLAGVIAYVVYSFIPEEVSEDHKITKARLLKIKNKEYDVPEEEVTKANKGLINAIISDEQYKFALFARFLEKYNLVIKLKLALKVAGIKADVSQFLFMVIILFLAGTVLGFFLGPISKVPWILGALVAYFLPFIMIKMKAGKRLNKFSAQLPDALGLIASSLRAGHSINAAFAIVVNELSDPIAGIFRMATEDMNLGRSTKEALEGMINNMPGSLDLRFFVTAVLIQREIGGNLAEILDSLNDTIRERFKLLGQLKSQTAQASLSGIVLALAPVFIAGVIYLLNPEYMEPLFTNPIGKFAVGLAVFLGVVGYLVIKKITSIKV
jgi:tight adherence protein B